MHRPKKGTGANSLSGKTRHGLSCVERHSVLKHQSVDPVYVFRVGRSFEGKLQTFCVFQQLAIASAHAPLDADELVQPL